MQLYIINNSIYDSRNNNYFKLKTSLIIMNCYDTNNIINIERNDLMRVIIQVTIMSYTTNTMILCLSFQST